MSAVNPADQGWIGTSAELRAVLKAFRCDQDAFGRFCVGGNSGPDDGTADAVVPITSFMGAGQEVVVGPEAVFFVDGQPHNLCAALGVTSYGMGVKVIS